MLSSIFPADVCDIILEYKASIEHYDRFRYCLVGIQYKWLLRKVCRIYAYFNFNSHVGLLPP